MVNFVRKMASNWSQYEMLADEFVENREHATLGTENAEKAAVDRWIAQASFFADEVYPERDILTSPE